MVYPTNFFLKIGDILLPYLLEVYEHSATVGRRSTTMQEAVIVVLLKPGKNQAYFSIAC